MVSLFLFVDNVDNRFVYDEVLQRHIPRQPPKPADWWMDTERREKRIKRLSKKGYSPDGIAKKTGYNLGYVRRVLFGYKK